MTETYPTSHVKNNNGSVVLSMAYSEGEPVHDYPLITLHNTAYNATDEPHTWWWDFSQSCEVIESLLEDKYTERVGNLYGISGEYGIRETVKEDIITLYKEGQKCKFWK